MQESGSDESESDDKGDSSDDSEEDSDESSEEEKSEKDVPAPKKRKAEAEAPIAAKKSRVDASDEVGSGNLFVGNLSWNTSEQVLRDYFEEFGTLSGVRIMTDRQTGKPRGQAKHPDCAFQANIT